MSSAEASDGRRQAGASPGLHRGIHRLPTEHGNRTDFTGRFADKLVTQLQGKWFGDDLRVAHATVATSGLLPRLPQGPNLDLVQRGVNLLVRQAELLARKEQTGASDDTPSVSVQERLSLIRSGKVDKILERPEILLQSGDPQALDRRIASTTTEFMGLLEMPGVGKGIKDALDRKVEVVRSAIEVGDLERLSTALDDARMRLTRSLTLGGGRTLHEDEIATLTAQSVMEHEAQRRHDLLMADPDIADHVRILKLQEYRRQRVIEPDHFAVTPSRRVLIDTIKELWAEGHKVLATGHTGVGKSHLFSHAAHELFGEEIVKVGGHARLSNYELYGHTVIDEHGTHHQDGPIPQAFAGNGRPILFDEFNRAPSGTLFTVKELLTFAGPGAHGKIGRAHV